MTTKEEKQNENQITVSRSSCCQNNHLLNPRKQLFVTEITPKQTILLNCQQKDILKALNIKDFLENIYKDINRRKEGKILSD